MNQRDKDAEKKRAIVEREMYNVKRTLSDLQLDRIQPKHCYMIYDHSIDEQVEIFKIAIEKNQKIKDLITTEEYVFKSVYKGLSIPANLVAKGFCKPTVVDRNSGKPLHIALEEYIRKVYSDKCIGMEYTDEVNTARNSNSRSALLQVADLF